MKESVAELKRLLAQSAIVADSQGSHPMLAYLALLIKWNPRINLTATTEWTGIGPLFEEAIRASAFYPEHTVSHLDIGSGNGFPAIPLRILRPRMRLDMVESRNKRCVFLETVANTLELGEVRVHNMRLKQFLESCARDRVWDIISWKAIKLETTELQTLRAHAKEQTEFWMFHGRELAVEDPAAFEKDFRLKKSICLERSREWTLSMYCPG
ncbi:MAG: class I SAM-dependent methyltransferase [Acidobacteriota bacterium]|nr:class I SAM-dependent methyltransferase [Acidobacteriota bacterium]